MKDQIELLTHDKNQTEITHPQEVNKILKGMSARDQEEKKSLLDSVAADEEDEVLPGEGHRFQDFETVLTWIVYAIAIGVAIALTWSVVTHIKQYAH